MDRGCGHATIQHLLKNEIGDFWTAYFEHVVQVGHLIAEEHSVEYLANELELYPLSIHRHNCIQKYLNVFEDLAHGSKSHG